MKHQIKLEQNYRSSGRILKVANQLIANNPHTFEKKLWSELGYGDPLRVLSHKSDQLEAKQVAAEIVHHRFKHGGSYSDYAILYRGNHQSRLFERELREIKDEITFWQTSFECATSETISDMARSNLDKATDRRDKYLNDRGTYLSNRSKSKWYQDGEKGTKYFLNILRSKSNKDEFI